VQIVGRNPGELALDEGVDSGLVHTSSNCTGTRYSKSPRST
jgi:hypothetical protein